MGCPAALRAQRGGWWLRQRIPSYLFSNFERWHIAASFEGAGLKRKTCVNVANAYLKWQASGGVTPTNSSDVWASAWVVAQNFAREHSGKWIYATGFYLPAVLKARAYSHPRCRRRRSLNKLGVGGSLTRYCKQLGVILRLGGMKSGYPKLSGKKASGCGATRPEPEVGQRI